MFFDVVYLALLAWKGLLEAFPVAVGLALILPYALGVIAGQGMFDAGARAKSIAGSPMR